MHSPLFFNMFISLSNNINQQHQIQFQSAKYLKKITGWSYAILAHA